MFGRNNNTRGGGPADHSNQPVCKFFLEGRCRFGDNCKNYHPRNQGSGFQTQNRFAPLQNGANNRAARPGGFGSNDRQSTNDPREETFAVTVDGIKADLTAERPIWPLSSYGPGLNAPRQLLEGALEQSFEEVRLQYYIAQAAGNVQEYVQNEKNMLDQSNQQVQAILQDLEGARKYVISAQYEHPNRNDAVIRPTTAFPKASTPAPTFGQQTGGFGQPSTLGANNAAASGFGRPSALGGQPSAFGAPSALGGASAFGKPSTLGNAAASSGFGKPSPLGGGPAFGAPSALGQTSAFGKPAQTSAFGAPNALGAAGSTFGQPSKPGGFGLQPSNTAFGQPSQPSGFATVAPQTGGGFGQPSAFGAPSANAGSAFGQPSAFGANANKPSPFAAATQNTTQQSSSPFAAATTQQPAPSGFGAPTAPRNPFGAQPTNGFGAPSTQSPFAPKAESSPSPFAQPSSSGAGTAFGGGAIASGANGANGIGNKQILYNEDGTAYYLRPDPADPRKQKKVRIWMPNGPPTAPQPQAEGPAEAYEGEAGAKLKEVYDRAMQKGAFEPGLMPEIPPKRDWISWDL